MAEAQGLSRSTAQAQPRAREADVYVASQWKLVWLKFRRHRLAMASLVFALFIYGVALIPEFLAAYPADAYAANYTYAPPMRVILIDRSGGGSRLAPHMLGYKVKINAESLAREFTVDPGKIIYLGLFVKGAPYKLLGLVPWDIHLIGPLDPVQRVYLLGADRLGRDVYSRLIFGTRISLSIGMIGVLLSLVLGILLGGISGYFGGWVDNLIQRMVEFLRSLPTIPLWLGLAAAIPKTTPPMQVYFIITIILSFIGWTGLAREVRGRFLSLRSEDYVTAARLDGANEMRVIFEQMLPAFTSHIIASVTLSIPQMILSETALSFLGLGLREPQVSWGVLLQEAQNVRAISQAPWLLIPALAVIVTVLALNFLGDGLRDAADPYAR